MSGVPWYKTFFGTDYLRIYSPFLPPERTEREVAGIIKLLNLPRDSSLLDLCCGPGRHALPLVQQGYSVTGLDQNEHFLQQAQAAAEAKGIEARWVQSDMRTIPFQNEFDAIINIFTSFGYLEDEDEDLRVLQQVQQALKPNGRFLLETVYQPRVLRNHSPHGIIRYNDGLVVLEERQLDLRGSRNEITITMLFPDGQRSEHKQSIRIYTLTELARMLAEAGMQLQGYYGDLDGSPLTLDSRLVVLGQKSQ